MVRAILEGRKTQTRRVVTKHNSEIGEGGDWANLCWDGSAIYHDIPIQPELEHLVIDRKAPLPFIDPGFGDHTYQYLHVPYRWAEDQTVYRVYPRIEPGDRLWVRETWCPLGDPLAAFANGTVVKGIFTSEMPTVYKQEMDAGGATLPEEFRWKSGRFMPRWASRITLEVVSVKPERLQDITEQDAKAEGIIWASNPFCWRIEFKRMEAR